MIRSLALPIALVALAASCAPLLAQPSAQDAAEAAQLVAARADSAFERIDPDREMSPQIDTVLPAGTAQEEPAMIYASLPPLAADDEVTFASADAASEAPRGPAVRMIASEVVQPIPVAVPASARSAPVSNDPFVIKSILPIEGGIRYGEWFWDESAAPRSGKLVITVDLDARVISAFRDGHEIGTAVALLGTQKHPTPLGTFPILTKEKDNISEKYNNAPMPWTLRLTWDGIAIHGSPVLNGYASHGCIGVPDEFAAKLFAAAKRGDKVIITRGKMVGVGDKVM
ncbi:L,D-transpeptidase family protein [Erythrobacter sp. sf7]|uniref:L,D-transpeptidase family protein n=1 Tax=Erythrobacter fulvus TaxID=2987523 RepID=A0ABT5JPF5_9SPHN|nr:L,D-transpeptidase family protein [Erythrobacter fulvus]MDC8754401.1 L,D-transpeptidase family protein [Erythrobacter fulvus]